MLKKQVFSNRVPKGPLFLAAALACTAAFGLSAHTAHGAWDLSALWDTGDINLRPTRAAGVYDRDQTGSSLHFLAPVQHGVKSYTSAGVLEWTYTGIPNGYDVRRIIAADLQGTGYNDTIVIGAGFATTAGWYQLGIVDKDGNELQEIKLTTDSIVRAMDIDGTDIYLASTGGITKLIKSGSTWSEDTTNWDKALSGGAAYYIKVADTGNGKRIYAVVFNGSGDELYSFQTDGTEEWSIEIGNYAGQFAIGKVDSTLSGDQIMVPYQGGVRIIDKDGTTKATITTGNNVRTGITLYDSDSDGEEEIYYGDMGNDMYSFERTGVNTYTQKYSSLDNTNQPGLLHYDLDEDGEDEIIAGTADGYLKVFSADLSTIKKSIYVGTSQLIGGNHENNIHQMHGTLFEDITGDGHADLLFTSGLGILYAYESTGLSAPESPARVLRLKAGVRLKGGVRLR